MDKQIAIGAVAVIAVIAVLFFFMQPPKPTGLVVGFFAGCGNGVCDPADPYEPGSVAETYATCPQDCCDNDCTAKDDSICRADCNGSNGCSIVSACNGLARYQSLCANSADRITCCGTQTRCDTGTFCGASPLGIPSCVSCSTVCDSVCRSSNCFGTDPDCDTVGGTTGFCDANSDCNDADALTVDVCLSPGTCAASCSYTACSVRCNDSAGCNDNNTMTADVCNRPGFCDANCTHPVCSVACNGNEGCNDNNALTTDTCLRPGACDANCTYVPTCSIRCDENSDCSDGLPLTRDICNNPNTCSSSCSNPACTAACSNNAGCNDNNSLTIDVCRNPGDCAATCSNRTCPVACDTNSDCKDNNAFTADVCLNPSTCNAKCSHPRCVIACSADANCNDNNALTIDACLNPGDCNASCSHSRQQLSIELQIGFEVVVRSQTVDLTLRVKDEADNPVSDAIVYLTDAEGNTITFNSIGNGYYTGQYVVPSNSPLGTKRFSFSAESGGKTAYQELSLDVAKGNINVILVQPTAFGAAVGQEVEIKFKLVYDNNAAVQGATANAVLKGTVLPLQFDGTVFTGKHLFGEADAGEAALVINAADTAGNSGAATFTFNVVQPFPWFLVVLLLLLVITIIVALFVLKKKRVEKLQGQQGKWGFKEEG